MADSNKASSSQLRTTARARAPGAQSSPLVDTRPFRVLLVEDEPASARLMIELLADVAGNEFQIEHAAELSAAVDRLNADAFDAVLLDLGLPGVTGLESLDAVRRANAEIPVVVLTGLANEAVALEALKAGAQDYLVKGQTNADNVVRSLTYAIERVRTKQGQERRFQAMVQHSTDMLVVVDTDGRVAFQSPSVEQTLGYRLPLVSRPLDAIHPDDLMAVRRAWRRVRANPGGVVRLEGRVRHGNGSWRNVEAVAQNLLLDEAVRGVVVNVRDVTDRRQTLQLLETQSRALAMIARGSPIEATFDLIANLVEERLADAQCTIVTRSELGGRARTGPELPPSAAAIFASPASIDARSAPVLAAESMKEVLIDDLRTLRKPSSWRRDVLDRGYLSCWSYPVVGYSGQKLLGVVAIYAKRTGLPTPVEAEVIATAVRLAGVAAERERDVEQLTQQALHDALTGLPNRALLDDRLDHAVKRAKASNNRLSVLFLDLDRFKDINDGMGHPAGDSLLRILARRLQAAVREGDTVARFGGDEFVVVCEDTGRADAVALARRLQEALIEPVHVRGRQLSLTVSIGVATSASQAISPDVLLSNADAAMYRAKERGRNRVETFHASARRQIVKRLDTTTEIRRALTADEFRLHYQPQVELISGRIVGVEALIRWEHPKRGMVLPSEFIPVVEHSGLAIEVGEWVLATACNQMGEWFRQGLVVPVCVNVAAGQLADPGFPVLVQEAITRSKVPPQLLSLEVTESVLVEEEAAVSATVDALAKLDVRFGIDDFGTGYSSLLYLKRFPASMLKIDISFVRGIENHRDRAIIRAVVSLAKELGMTTVAEGVETQRQLEALIALGCVAGQGYLWARPMPAREVTRLLRQSPGRASAPGGHEHRAPQSRDRIVAVTR